MLQQTCKVCNQPDKFNFSVPDNIWNLIVPTQYQNKVICLSCFDNFAFEAKIDYQIQELYFCGYKSVFEFGTKSAVNL